MNKNAVMISNEEIDVPQVRLIGEAGEQIGIISTREALQRAKNLSLDLVLVSPAANPPVAKIMDQGRAAYEAKKKAKAAKANQTIVQTKEIQLRPVTDVGDLHRKINDARKFLEKGNKVKFFMKFRGRERSHADIGMGIMQEIIQSLGESANIEKPPVMNGNSIIMIVS